jgi:hypothetical protein
MTAKPSGIVNIRGRDYQTVAYRVGLFREKHPDWTLQTEIIHRDSECVVIKASLLDENGRIRSTGHSEEYRKSSTINKTSALENAETSAIGRALAGLGFGGTEFASADELVNALQQQAGIHRPSDGAWERLPEDRQIEIRELGTEMVNLMAQGMHETVFEKIEEMGLDPDEKVSLWTCFGSKDRAMLKKIGATRKEAA